MSDLSPWGGGKQGIGDGEGAPRASGDAAWLLSQESQTQQGVRQPRLSQSPAVRP